MEANIKNTFIKVFETLLVLNENCIEICKSQIMEWHQMFIKNYKSDNEQMNLMIHLVTKIIRLLYQENLHVSKFFKGIFYHKNLMISKKLIISSESYKIYSLSTLNLIIWMTDREIIDYTSFLVIVEDILETVPINDLEILFDRFESNLKIKSYSSFNIDTRKLTMLKISNTILKRLSSSMDTKLRGRVQMALASIFPISDKSGVNQKGLYNLNNIMGKLNTQGDSDSKVSNFRFYKQFWVVMKYISNPLSLFQNGITSDDQELEYINLDKNNLSVLGENIIQSASKIEIFLNNISKILKFFENYKIDLTDKSDTVLSYPKYLTSPDLFELQLRDSSFRLTIFSQFYIVLKSFLRPVSQAQKKIFNTLTEIEKNKISEIIIQISDILKSNDSYFKKFMKIIKEEQSWENWKESGCQNFEKFPSEEIKKQIEESRKLVESRIKNEGLRYKPIKSRTIFKVEGYGNYDFNKAFDVNMNDLKNFKVNSSYQETLRSENPFIGNFIERVFRDNDPEMDIEESIMKKDETFCWKFLRLVSLKDISRLNNECVIESIIKEYSEKYGRQGIKFLPKDFNSNKNVIIEPLGSLSNPININTLAESPTENKESLKTEINTSRSDRDKQFIKKKRSFDRNDGASYSSHNKKRKLD